VFEGHSLGGQPSSLLDHVLEGEAREVLAHVVADFGPHAEQDALSLVVAGTIAVGLTEVTGDDRAVDRGHNFGQGDGGGVASQHVATTDAALGANESDALQTQQNLLEVGLRETGALGQVTNGNGQLQVIAKSETQ